MFKIVTDSLSDMPAELAGRLGITLLPVYIHLGDETYQDGMDITPEEFYQKLERVSSPPRTSVPGPGFIASIFKKLSQETNEILAIISSSKVSSMYRSAVQAKTAVNRECRIEIIDSLVILGGEMFLTVLAQEQLSKGASLDETVKVIKEAMPRIRVRGALGTLDYLRQGGRLGRAQPLAGGAVKTIPIIELKNGEAYPCTRVKTMGQAADHLVSFARSLSRVEMMSIEEATTSKDTDYIAGQLGDIVPPEKLYRGKFSAAVGAHTGPGAIALSIMEAR